MKAAGLFNFEKGVPSAISPDLPMVEQVDLLPYDKKYELPKEQLKLGTKLGSGAYGTVFKANAQNIVPGDTETAVAVKMANDASNNQVYF